MMNYRNPKLTKYSQKLRKEMTPQERHLGYGFLKTLPVQFYRQKVIGEYIVDFYCASKKLVVELDGSQHYEPSGVDTDRKRDAYFSELGLTVLRYSNKDINERFASVCEDIWNYLQMASPRGEAVSEAD